MENRLRETLGQVLARATRPLPPWWNFRLYHHVHKRLLGDPYWCSTAPTPMQWAPVYPHGYEMELSPAHWMERYALQAGRFYASEMTAVIQQFLRPGDSFVDVGANLGFMTLAAARAVGATGAVFSFEPNKTLVGRLERMLARNAIANVTIFPCALGSETGEIGFTQEFNHGINHVLADLATAPVVVPLRRADDLLAGRLPDAGAVLVKMDVEGAELMALRGMPNLVNRANTVFVMEICDIWLRQNGGSAAELFALMTDAGFEAYLPHFSPVSFKMQLRKLSGPLEKDQYDALFRRPSLH
jgi:FkbM family methyltransferase